MRHTIIALLAAATAGTAAINAQVRTPGGGLTSQMLQQMQQKGQLSPQEKALQSALSSQDINTLALDRTKAAGEDTYFSNTVPSQGITDQQSSGRCWLFTGLNVMRAKMMQRFGLQEFRFSQNYVFFYDQLEKANLFLQTAIDWADQPFDSKRVEWLFKHPISDGGQFTGLADLIGKYGLVPSTVMPETYASEHTSHMSQILSQKLREYGLRLRQQASSKAPAEQLQQQKAAQLDTVYHILTLFLGTPPRQFEWTAYSKDGKPIGTEQHTPQSFYKKYVGTDLRRGYVMLMNDPLRPYYQTFEIEMDRHTYDGGNWVYINLPADEIRRIAISSIKDSTALYFSCDVGKFLNTKNGVLDMGNYNYADFLGTSLGMSKRERVQTFASASSHAMTLMGVDLRPDGTPRKWEVENSWGADYGHKGHLIMSDAWFGEYMFRLVPERKYVDSRILALLKQKPTLLPPWDPMFAPEQ